mmetsp:Transcript_58047/g.66891  ORF Transcript_58047/g.66891 Transcript_58047/m.66891 type:complete len:302 (-) Transcript_58047:713-1618(-)
MRLDLLIHQRLGHACIVVLVVSVAAVAHKVDDNRLLELGAEVGCKLKHTNHILGTVTVHVEHRALERAAKIGAVCGASGAFGVRRETNLIVDDNVNRTTSVIVVDLRDTHRLIDDTLAREGSITVQLNGQHLLLALSAILKLGSLGLALNKRVHCLQVGWVGQHFNADVFAITRFPHTLVSQMVLDVRLHLEGSELLGLDASELLQNHLKWLSASVVQHTQAAAMGHSKKHLLHTALRNAIQEGADSGHQDLTTVESEALLIAVFASEVVFEVNSRCDLLQNPLLILSCQLLVQRVLRITL